MEEDDKKYTYMNKYMDTLPMFLNWELDVIIYFMSGFFGYIILDGFLAFASIGFGFGLAFFYSKIKHTKYKNFIKHIFYMFGFQKTKQLPNSYIKNLRG